MSELREAIRDKVKGIATDATVHDMPYSERFARYEMHTDALIEIVREALLSEQAVVAGSKEIVRFKWANAPEAVARAVIESNVAAAGLTNDPA